MRRLLTILCCAVLFLSACAGSREVATIGDDRISSADFDKELDLISLALSEADVVTLDDVDTNTFPSDFAVGQLGQWIDNELLTREVERRGIEVTVDDTNAATQFFVETVLGGSDPALGEQRRQAVDAEHLQESIDRYAGQQAMLRTITEEVRAEIGTDEGPDADVDALVCLAVLVNADADVVADAQQRALDGEDFSALVDELSDDEASAASQGDLGCLPEVLVTPQLGEVTDGQVFDPFSDPSGVTLLYKVTDVGFPDDPDYADLASRIPEGASEAAAQAQAQGGQGADAEIDQEIGLRLQALLIELRTDADVTVDPRYGTWDPTTGLVPPAGPVGTTPPLLDQ